MKNKQLKKIDYQEFFIFTVLSDCTWSILQDKELKPYFDAIYSVLSKRINNNVNTDYEPSNLYVVQEYKKVKT